MVELSGLLQHTLGAAASFSQAVALVVVARGGSMSPATIVVM